ncbi:extracellular solute-binding protein [Cetobacterium sp. 2A]|uniref:extracellular solute-binding protein n=1 Tax=Cetobacterium sp. 2A TaxID=2754723 RepID=UPI00163B8194|nr:extracellular solute-binding protein [Cetobacterium sp. 2A]MBC2854950.1 extracellular solute-binding protein [Cetobacterium sp. 2A]
MKNKIKSKLLNMFLIMMTVISVLGIGSEKIMADNDVVLIYSNAEDEYIDIMNKELNKKGLEDKVEIVKFSTSDLAGKIEIENKNTEADILTFSSFYLETYKDKYDMLKKHAFDETKIVKDFRNTYYIPFIAFSGSIFYNTIELEKRGLPVPQSYKELANPIYKGQISFPNLESSTTGWLMIQAILDNYDTKEAKVIIDGIKTNAGPHIEASGSAPIKKVQSGEVAIGVGMRHQAEMKKMEGIPMEVSDPKEGNYIITESFALVNDTPQIRKVLEIITSEPVHKEISTINTAKIYESDNVPTDSTMNPRIFSKPLTKDLLDEHIRIFKK